MKKPYFYVKAIGVLAFMLLQTSFAQEVENQKQTNTGQTNSAERAVRSAPVTYGATGGTGLNNDAYYPNPFLDDILTSKSPGSVSGISKSFQVDRSTGKVNVTVPIATVGPEGLKIPIQLNYTTGGIKVADVASWVGLGWDLSAGGKITRVMRRFPDKFDHSLDTLLDERTWVSRFYAGNKDNFDTRFKNDDTQPDLFYFEIPGKSGMFAFDKDNKAHTIPFQNVKINYDISSQTFEIIDEQGSRYYFNDTENTYVHDRADEIEDKYDLNYKSTWYLSSVHNVKGENVSFEYKHLNNQRKHFYETKVKSQTARIYNSKPWISVKTDSGAYENYIDPLYLTKISWNSGHVEFISTADRADIPDQQAFKLNNIKLYADANVKTLLSSYNFEYSTFNHNNNALKLNKITVSGGTAGTAEFFRKFDYFPITGVGSNEMVQQSQIDHWGYYNGPGYRTGMPNVDILDNNNNDYKDPDDPFYFVGRVSEGDQRTPVLVHSLANALQRVWVTSSGYDEFEYELNTRRYYMPWGIRDSIVVENVGGLRIKSITTKSTELVNVTNKVRYEYTQDDCASSGVTFNDPRYYFLASIENGFLYYTIKESSVLPLFDLDGSHIRYGKVKEIFDNGSSNTYYYTTKDDAPDNDYIIYNIAKRNTIVTAAELSAKLLDFAPHNTQFWKRGLLTKKISLDALGNETRSETFEYSTNAPVKGRVKGIYPVTDKMYVYTDHTIPPGVPGVDYPGMPRVQWMFKNIYLIEYEYQSQSMNMTKRIVKGIDIPETTTLYSYSDFDNAVLLKDETVTSGGVSYLTTYRYPFNYNPGTVTEVGNAIAFMKENNISAAPIEIVKYKNGKIIGGELYIYDKWHYVSNGSITGAMFNLREVKELLLKKPKLSGEFRAANYLRGTQEYKFLYDNSYVTKVAYEYNGANKVSCIKERNRLSQSILYDKMHKLPVAQITNAEAKVINGSPCEEAFYTSFEDADGVMNSRAKTGSKVLNGVYYTDMSHLVAGTYCVSYWGSYNGGVDWELFEHEVEIMQNDNRPFMIGGQGFIIDEYRIWKKGSQMKTRTYSPKLNITSETDENGQTTYYNYDWLGRVIGISDNNGDKLKEYEYFIKN